MLIQLQGSDVHQEFVEANSLRRKLQVRQGDRHPRVVRAAEEFSQVQDMLTETE